MTAIAVQQCAPDKICPETVYPRIQWSSLTPLVLSWLHMVSYGLVRPPLAPFDPIWPSTATFDHIFPGLACLTLFDIIWPGFAPFDPVLPSTARQFCTQRWKKGWSTGVLLPEGNGQDHSWQNMHNATRASCNACIMQHMNYATYELCNICIIQHVHFVTHA